LARALYATRQELVKALGLRGQITASMITGYGPLRDRMSPAQYCDALVAGRLRDPTLSVQLGLGFEIRAILPNHLHDPACADTSVLIVLPAATPIAAERGASG
jgi:hypothetical protein